MMLLAARNLLAEKMRFAFSAAGIGLAVFLISVLLGIFQGWNNKVGGFVSEVDTDIWVARDGTTDFINAASILPASMGDEMRARDDVSAAVPLIVRPMAFEHDGDKVEVHLIGYDVDSGVGGPAKIVKGKGAPTGNEIVIDEVLSKVSGVGIGDELTSSGMTLTISGIASGGNFAFTQAGFVSEETAAELLGMGDLVTFWLLTLDDGADADATATDIQGSTDGVEVFTSDEFASATRHRILDNVLPILFLIVGLAFIVGIAITSLTIYTATIERAREFGVMKAIGFNNRDLYALVVLQSVITGAIGFVFGVALTLLLSMSIDIVMPAFVILIRPLDVGLVLIATVFMAAAAAIVPARRVGGVDPAIAFKG
jgi:putative ABC transport system permease protein